MSSFPGIPFGLPGLKSLRTATPNDPLWSDQGLILLPNSGVVDGTKSRDAQNASNLGNLRGGLLMGRVTSGGKFAPSFLGTVGTAYSSGTSLVVPSPTGDEIVRRIGTSGTFKVVGPPAAAGVVRTTTVTYSAVAGASGGNRTITITALGAAKVERFRFGTAATAGNLQLAIAKTDGTLAITGNAAWSATDATYISNLNTALDAAGTAGAIVASAISAVDTDFGFELTYTAANYPTGPAFPAQVALLPTSATAPVYTVTTAASDPRFVAGSLICPTDGSELPIAIQGDPWGLRVLDDDGNSTDATFAKALVGGVIDTSKLINYPTDTSLITWLQNQLNVYGRFVFNTNFVPA